MKTTYTCGSGTTERRANASRPAPAEFNPETCSVETALAEGDAGGMPWKALRCVSCRSFGGFNGIDEYTVIRIYCRQLTLDSYASLFASDGLRLMHRLDEMKRPDGKPYNPKFGTVWPAKSLYVQFKTDDVGRSEWEDFARGFADEMSPELLRMAVSEDSV